MGRSPCCSDEGGAVKKGSWSPEEDDILVKYVKKNGPGNWQTLPKRAGLNRCGKSCRLRWTNYLRPDIKRGPFSEEEEAIITNLHQELGNKWSRIAAYLPGRTDNEIKNYWNTHLKKKLLRSGIDPKTHKQISDLNLLYRLLLSNSNISNLIFPVNPILGFHGNFQILQKLQNLFRVINSSPLPYLQAVSTPQFINVGPNTQSFGGGNYFFEPQSINVLATDHLNNDIVVPSPSNSLQCFEGEMNLQEVPFHNNRGFYNINNNSKNSVPLVSVTPGSSIVKNPTESTMDGYIPSRQEFGLEFFDTLENFLDDEASSSFLREIMG